MFWRRFYLRLHLKTAKNKNTGLSVSKGWPTAKLNSFSWAYFKNKFKKTHSSVPSREEGGIGQVGQKSIFPKLLHSFSFSRARICLVGDDSTLFPKPTSLGTVESRVRISWLISLLFLSEIKDFPSGEESSHLNLIFL